MDETYVSPITGDADFGPWPSDTTGRDYFYTPGVFNIDLGAYKNTRITERVTLQLRLEAFNFINHSNLYINEGSAYVISRSGFITASYGLPNVDLLDGTNQENRNIQLAAKIIF